MRKGFTLVELAIVIVIIGLLVGGVLQGQELIKQAKYRTLIKDIEGYKTAATTFYSKYNCLAGDCINAHSFLTACGTNAWIESATTGCNGNGDKSLTTKEGQLFWQHLVKAKMITGSYGSGYSNPVVIGTDVPLSSFGESVGISVFHAQGNPAATACGFQYCSGDYQVRGGMLGRNVFNMGNNSGIEDFVRGAFMTPADNYAFDIKFDDGLFYSGSISGFNGILPSGAAGRCGYNPPSNLYYNADAAYKDIIGCRLVFDMGH